jgi:UDP-N-acetyl-D-mannosaminuronic acid dehydrogenase
VENQYHDLDEFLDNIDIVVIMVAHDEIINNLSKFNDKYILDTRNIIFDKNTYKL